MSLTTSKQSNPAHLIQCMPLQQRVRDQLHLLENLTFPSYRDFLRQAMEGSEDYIALAAFQDSLPVGLFLARYDRPARSVQLLSISVDPAMRNRGIAGMLLEFAYQHLCEREIVSLEAVYTSALAGRVPFERIISDHGWSKPQPRILFCRGTVARMHREAPWIRRVVLPEAFKIFDWEELTPKDREQLNEDIDAEILPSELSPFYQEDLIDLATSVGIRYQGKVIGWQINHPLPLEQGVLRYSRTYVYPEFQRTGRGIIVIKESIERHMQRRAEDFPYFLSDVAYERSAMVRFYKRHIIPHSDKSYSSYYSSKQLS